MENQQDLAYILITALSVTTGLFIFILIIMRKFQVVQQKKQEELYQAVLQTQEMEQNRIGQDLHDEICPNLAVINFKIQAVLEEVSLSSHIKSELSKAEEMTSLTSRLVREASHNLVPKALKEGNFNDALDNLVSSLSSSKQEVALVENQPVKQQLSTIQITQLYRVAKELLYNAIKHSKAEKISVSLSIEKNTLKLSIMDNGIGIPNTDIEDGVGLSSVRNRLKILKASINIESTTNGTNILITLPI